MNDRFCTCANVLIAEISWKTIYYSECMSELPSPQKRKPKPTNQINKQTNNKKKIAKCGKEYQSSILLLFFGDSWQISESILFEVLACSENTVQF